MYMYDCCQNFHAANFPSIWFVSAGVVMLVDLQFEDAFDPV